MNLKNVAEFETVMCYCRDKHGANQGMVGEGEDPLPAPSPAQEAAMKVLEHIL
jgi:hypothetical protein